ncbi:MULTISPECIES: amidase [unclassified Paenibacillus]|uniref:amidase n=1 Tax=unclassified Paenibacillus TaxID=185978 RepID=UPI0024069B32|nr:MULTISPECIES: amidase [unclassified Paenibacillus]MDF9839395.1 aspartyl-tRNA(Asn)/glutamyl-tRNA(Gln) amidotransferase subunit A [Paenibacillus sp. PastF-2]MDF9845975.1 aspartyl-tRNA(Asn)/glutamyl-tRNA(Gln) amidotransferase subunit A [Paenibacillus sp. PastM-2]MDF9852548.1 aspartyl-tRNA(Asn)/glutamyl-tRNA(Gln) amidotransferase subunit A [Paenibacillus sp. PastF-1]MDH6477722.1 aspartyl-tRNA(Asn)/glutamyl-tRNA(Gln) amidotransferase subunit A [Paenibacillus sp. PastH-2]MDH6505461.1 aspartyl-tRN
MNPLHLTMNQLSKLYKQKDISPVEVTRVLLEETKKKDGELHSYTTITAESAISQAKKAESEIFAGVDRGPLHGIPFNLKDNILTAGISTQAGSPILKDNVPDVDAPVVPLLLNAGGVLLGKTNMLEFAYGETNLAMGIVNNPWNLAHTVSGSSSGSAASVASGLAYGSLGTDTAGSIRIPSSYCGLVGMKPTYGLVSCEGVIPLAWSMDNTGPMTRSVMDNAAMLGIISDFDYGAFARSEKSVRNLRIGIIDMGDDVTDEVRNAVNAIASELQKLGAKVKFGVDTAFLDDSSRILMPLLMAEASAAHEELLMENAEKYNPIVRDRLEAGSLIPAIDYIRAQRYRNRIVTAAHQVMDEMDILITPTTGAPAPRQDNEVDLGNITRYTCPFNIIGFSAMSLPCGVSASGMPLGLQVVGKPYTESTMYQVALACEEITGLSGLVAGGNIHLQNKEAN